MLGYDTPWVPTAACANADGTPSIVYKTLSSNYRGRLSQNSWGSYYYYKYVRGFNMDQRAPYFTEAYRRRTSYNWDGVDGGGEFWLYIPAAAEVPASVWRQHCATRHEVTGAGTTVDLDHINLAPGTALTAPVFADGGADVSLYTYATSTSTINRSFAASDANTGDVVSYQIDNMPAGPRSTPAPPRSHGGRRWPEATASPSPPPTAPRSAPSW